MFAEVIDQSKLQRVCQPFGVTDRSQVMVSTSAEMSNRLASPYIIVSEVGEGVSEVYGLQSGRAHLPL
jgi:hypothetical protein